jgi:hypothetical protein
LQLSWENAPKHVPPFPTYIAQATPEFAKKKKVNSSSYRWTVGATAEGEIQLQLQGIPLAAKEVKYKPLLNTDNVATAIPKSWPIQCCQVPKRFHCHFSQKPRSF